VDSLQQAENMTGTAASRAGMSRMRPSNDAVSTVGKEAILFLMGLFAKDLRCREREVNA
jgi:hypothetical protein